MQVKGGNRTDYYFVLHAPSLLCLFILIGEIHQGSNATAGLDVGKQSRSLTNLHSPILTTQISRVHR